MLDTLIIGGGQSGLAAGQKLQEAGLRFKILEAQDQVTGSWPQYYDSLELFSPALHSGLPGLPFPGDPQRYPKRDEVAQYLSVYAQHFSLPIHTGQRLVNAHKIDGGWRVQSASGDVWEAQTLIAATGGFGKPHQPNFPGQQEYLAVGGKIIHSAAYRRPQDYSGKRMLVIGAGNSAIQIAYELAQHTHTTLTSHKPVQFMPQRIAGHDVHDWLKLSPYHNLPLGSWFGTSSAGNKVLDTGRYRQALKQNKPNWRPLFSRFHKRGAIWQNGDHETFDVVICATGFLPHLDYLATSGALNTRGNPLQRSGISQVLPGLYYLGLQGQRSFISATLRGVGGDAAYILSHIQKSLKK
jgi:putative flavoprotein involved in K+ transport